MKAERVDDGVERMEVDVVKEPESVEVGSRAESSGHARAGQLVFWPRCFVPLFIHVK